MIELMSGSSRHERETASAARFGIDLNGLANFGKGRREFILSQQEIAVTPGDFSGNRIDALGLLKSIACGS